MTSTQTNIRSGLVCPREGWTCNLDRPHGGVPVAAEIIAGRAHIGGQGSYIKHLGWNPQSELSFAGIMGNTVESGFRERGLVKTIPPHQDILKLQSYR